MPIYSFECQNCKHQYDAYVPRIGATSPCSQCQSETVEKIWTTTVHSSVASAFPYITTNITGSPIEIKSAKHLEQVCREHGVTHRPDNAFLSKEYKGYSFRHNKQIYTEGSGLGMPGSWI